MAHNPHDMGAAPPTLDIQQFLNQHPFSPFQWLIFALCFVIVLLDGFDTAAIGFIAPSLIKEWGVTRAGLAPVLSAALFSRFSSRGNDGYANQVLSAMRAGFGGHHEKPPVK